MKKLLVVILSLLLVVSLSGCGANHTKLYILNWDEYIDEGLLDKFEDAGISVRVTSGMENRKTKSGKTSKHAVADAIDKYTNK